MTDEEYRKRGEEAYWELQRICELDFSDRPEEERKELEAERRKLKRYLFSISVEPESVEHNHSEEEIEEYQNKLKSIFTKGE